MCENLRTTLAILLLVLPAALMAQEGQRADPDDLGAVDFNVACDAEVRAGFDDALALMHHMMYEQARDAFRAVAEGDPECGMAHWGVAMTHFHPLWHPMDRAALEAGPTRRSGACAPRWSSRRCSRSIR